MSAAPKWAWVWYGKTFEGKKASDGGAAAEEVWLCPDCAGEFRSDRARNAFLRKALDDRGKPDGRR
jgi:hypothetical protein